jgi:guanylate kinase
MAKAEKAWERMTGSKKASMTELKPMGVLLILSAPSGGGKSTLASRLRERRDDVEISISHTTRAIRGEEVDGLHYHFVSDEGFLDRVAEGAFAEHAMVYGRRYGTSRQALDSILGRGHHVILDIDIQGGEQLMATYPDAVSVFVVPPTMEALSERLRARSTESDEGLSMRLALAKDEIRESKNYAYVVVNDQLDEAVDVLSGILDAEGYKRSRMNPQLEALLSEEPSEK